MTGFVYVMSNPSIARGLLKIGKSDRDPKKFRANELRTTGVPEPFVVEFLALVEDADALESAVHNFLSQYRNTSDREFFPAPFQKRLTQSDRSEGRILSTKKFSIRHQKKSNARGF